MPAHLVATPIRASTCEPKLKDLSYDITKRRNQMTFQPVPLLGHALRVVDQFFAVKRGPWSSLIGAVATSEEQAEPAGAESRGSLGCAGGPLGDQVDAFGSERLPQPRQPSATGRHYITRVIVTAMVEPARLGQLERRHRRTSRHRARTALRQPVSKSICPSLGGAVPSPPVVAR
jgi:hypothetical protein